jgi:hypothetical protein
MPTVTITQNPVLEDLDWFNMNWQGEGFGAGPFPTNPFGTPAASLAGPWEFGGKLYCVGHAGLEMPHPPPNFPSPPFPPVDPKAFGPLVIFASSDAGVTWSAPDVANRPYFCKNPVDFPVSPSGVIYQRIGNTIYFSMLVFGYEIPPFAPPLKSNVILGTFDLTTDAYGPLSYYDTGYFDGGGGGPVSEPAVFLWPLEMSGVVNFVGCDQNNGMFPGDPNLGKGRLLAGPASGTYAALTDITPAAFTGAHFLLTVLSVQVDAAGIAHIVFSSLSTIPGADVEFWYMRLYPDLHTDAFQQLVVPSPPGVTPSFGVASFNGADIVIPVWFNGDTLAVFRIANYSAVAPAISYEPIVQAPAITNVQWAATVTKGTRSVLFWCANPFSSYFREIDYSFNDGSGWSVGDRFCDGSIIVVPPGDYNNNGSFYSVAAALLANGDFGLLTGSFWQEWLAPFFTGNANLFLAGNLGNEPPPPPAPPPILVQDSRRLHILVPNHFDGCLHKDLLCHQRAKSFIGCCRPEIIQDIRWVRGPENSQPFRKVGAVPTPLAASGDVEVLDFQVPTGYDGLISGLFHLYNGPGFMEGGGDLEWRLLINKTYATNLGQILVTLGSQRRTYPVDGGIPVQSGQRIRYIVSAPNLSGGILPLNSQIVCGLEGLFYARQ